MTIRKSHKTIIVNNGRLGKTMNKRSSEEVARWRHRREKSTIDHLAHKAYAPRPAAKDLKEPTTERDRGAGPEEVGSEKRRPTSFLAVADPENCRWPVISA
jgi:hypothetical protein